MRKALLVSELDFVSRSRTDRRGGPFPNSINGEDRRLFERTREERARRVRFVMFEKHVTASKLAAQSFVHLARQMELFP